MNVQPKFSENDQLAEESDKSWGQSLVTALDGKANKSDLLTAIAHVNAKTGQEDLLKAIQALSTPACKSRLAT